MILPNNTRTIYKHLTRLIVIDFLTVDNYYLSHTLGLYIIDI